MFLLLLNYSVYPSSQNPGGFLLQFFIPSCLLVPCKALDLSSKMPTYTVCSNPEIDLFVVTQLNEFQ